jgi:signal transduction histidine kinase
MSRWFSRPADIGGGAAAGRHRHGFDSSLRTRRFKLTALPLLVLAGALGLLILAIVTEEQAEQQVRNAFQVQIELQRLDTVLWRAAIELYENRLAGTVGDLQDLQQAEAELPMILSRLTELIRDDEQRGRLARIVSDVSATLADLRKAAQTTGRPANLGALPLLVDLRQNLEGMRQRENAVLEARERSADAARTVLLLLAISAAVFGLAGSLLSILFFSTAIIRRVALLEANATRLAKGEPLMPAPMGTDEIGRLGDALEAASALLTNREQRLEYLVGSLFQAQEDERRRVAHDLHDGLAQVAAAAHQHLQAYAERFPPQDPLALASLSRVLDLAQRAVRDARAAIAGLRPTALDDFGLAHALRLEADALVADGRDVTFANDLGPERPRPLAETALFRICQEALTNIRKHAGPEARIHISLDHSDGWVRLAIQDDGCGFDAAEVARAARKPGERIGLDAIRERVAFSGGKVRITSAPGRGTLVEVQMRG